MGEIEYWKHICPLCGRLYVATLSRKPVFLGPGTRQCRKCKRAFQDGSSEWPQLPVSKKLFFLCPNVAMILLALAVFMAVFGWLTGDTLDERIAVAIVMLVFFTLPLLPMWVVKYLKIRASKRRHTAAQRKAMGLGAS